MKSFLRFSLLGIISFLGCSAKEPEIPKEGISFMVYFESRSRGICVGTLVSRVLVLTAAVCVVSLEHGNIKDTRPINVVVGTHYRNPIRGIRVQVTKIILPKIPTEIGRRGYLMQKSAALLVLRRKIPDILTDIPLRAVEVDTLGAENLSLHDECIMLGWHYFYTGDKIYPVKRFVLQRNMRFQLMHIVNKEVYCDTIVLKYEKITDDLGHDGEFVKNDVWCLKDPDFSAQPCHGMYGSPMICSEGRVVGMMMAPDAQWSNCTGYSVLVHQINNKRNKDFFACVKPLFEPEERVNLIRLKRQNVGVMDEEEEIIHRIYDGVITDYSSNTDEIN